MIDEALRPGNHIRFVPESILDVGTLAPGRSCGFERPKTPRGGHCGEGWLLYQANHADGHSRW